MLSGGEFVEAEKTARDKALRMVGTQVQEALDENLGAEDAKEWNWQALAGQVNKRYNLKTSDRQLKQMGKDNLGQYLIEQGEKAIAEVDLNAGQEFLEEGWGQRALSDWVRLKFGVKLDPAALAGKGAAEVVDLLHEQVMAAYRQKEIEFPVKVGMARFMADKAQV